MQVEIAWSFVEDEDEIRRLARSRNRVMTNSREAPLDISRLVSISHRPKDNDRY